MPALSSTMVTTLSSHHGKQAVKCCGYNADVPLWPECQAEAWLSRDHGLDDQTLGEQSHLLASSSRQPLFKCKPRSIDHTCSYGYTFVRTAAVTGRQH